VWEPPTHRASSFGRALWGGPISLPGKLSSWRPGPERLSTELQLGQRDGLHLLRRQAWEGEEVHQLAGVTAHGEQRGA